MTAMTANSGQADSNLSRLAVGIASLAGVLRHHAGLYPVLGADDAGGFFVEIASGPLQNRQIHSVIHITFLDARSAVSDLASRTGEQMLCLPDASWLMALIVLLATALGTGPELLHPVSRSGTPINGWNEALAAMASIAPQMRQEAAMCAA
jgi:hypothetical protein